jgi:hypothetical protein
MSIGRNILQSFSDEKLHYLMKSFLKSLDPVLLSMTQHGSSNTSFTDEQFSHSLISASNDVTQRYLIVVFTVSSRSRLFILSFLLVEF